jgi:hypothetical protein
MVLVVKLGTASLFAAPDPEFAENPENAILII